MKTRSIVSPYYDFKVFQSSNPYLKTSSSSGEKSTRLRSVATGEERKSHESSRKSSTNSGKREFTGEKMIPDGGNKPEPLNDEELSDYQQLSNQSKFCQTSSSLKQPQRVKRVKSKNFFSLSQQMMNKS